MAFKLFGKNSNYSADYKKFKKAMERNPGDHGLKAQFIKFCLLNRFTKEETIKDHITEALTLFDTISQAETFDMHCHYLVGKYYQEDRDNRRAYQIYLNAVRRFNEIVGADPDLKSENVEFAYSMSLNLMTLQLNPVDPEVEKCFKIIHKSYPMHLKRIELEHEMSKPAPDKNRIKLLSMEIRNLKAEEEKENPASSTTAASSSSAAPEKNNGGPEPKAPEVKPKEGKGINSKLFAELAPDYIGFDQLTKKPEHPPHLMPEKNGFMDSFRLSPLPDNHDAAYMVYHEAHNQWEGPFKPEQMRTMPFVKSGSWVCRSGSDHVVQAYEVPALQALLQAKPV